MASIVAYGLFVYEYIGEDYDEALEYINCKLLKNVGDLKAGQHIKSIRVECFNSTKITFHHNSHSYSFYLDASPVNLCVKSD